MTKAEFFLELELRLKRLPQEERNRVLRVYDELFEKAIANGKNEREITRSLGCPDWISPDIRVGSAFMQHTEDHMRTVFAAIGLGLFNLVFVLGPFLAVNAALLSLLAVSAALMVSPLALATGVWKWTAWHDPVLMCFAGIALFGAGLLIGLGSVLAMRKLYHYAVRYVRLNLTWIKEKSA